MTEQTRQKILVGIDESERALRVVRYLSRIPTFRKKKFVLLNVASDIPESYWDVGPRPLFGGAAPEVRAWKVAKRLEIDSRLAEARQALVDAGVDGESVVAICRKRQQGFARDLIGEARNDYEAIAIGRRGMGALANLVLGSMAMKLLEGVDFAPLLLIGKKASTDRVLVAFDNSENANRALDYAASALRGGSSRLRLVFVVRNDEKRSAEKLKKWIAGAFERAIGRLEKSGFPPGRLSARIIPHGESRAAAIVSEARKHGYGTIVVGRRGFSDVDEFSMGRVTNKVVHLARGLGVWVVN
jgi:nucleotide-binding universal stress UspA family protein